VTDWKEVYEELRKLRDDIREYRESLREETKDE